MKLWPRLTSLSRDKEIQVFEERDGFEQVLHQIQLHRGFEYVQSNFQEASIVHKNGIITTAPLWTTIEHLWRTFQNLAEQNGSRLDLCHPYCGGYLERLDLRWHVCIPPLAGTPCSLAIRHMQWKSACDLDQVVPHELMEMLRGDDFDLLLIAGETGSGKTTLLHALLHQLYATRRVLIAEAIPELKLSSGHWFRLKTVDEDRDGHGGVDWDHLIAQALRLLPQKIVIGELRNQETQAIRLALHASQSSIWSTIHASSTEHAIRRLNAMLGPANTSLGGVQCVVIHLHGGDIGWEFFQL